MKFYAVTELEYSVCLGSREAWLESDIWTVSPFPDHAIWNTDSGRDSYGLTYAQARFIADAANEKVGREGDKDNPFKEAFASGEAVMP